MTFIFYKIYVLCYKYKYSIDCHGCFVFAIFWRDPLFFWYSDVTGKAYFKGIVNKEEDGPNNSSNGNNNNRIINNNKQQRSTQWNTSMDRCTKSGAEEHEFVNLSRADSALSNESTASSQVIKYLQYFLLFI